MWLIFLLLPITLVGAATYHQSDYTIKLERVELVSYNRSYWRNATCGLVHHNHTYRAINASLYLLKDLSRNIKVTYQLYKFLSNEYRFFPLTMTVDGCKELERDNFGVKESLQKSVNFEMRCPIKKGFLQMVYGEFDYSTFPPYIPHGEYKADMNVYDNLNFLMNFNYYAKIEEVIKKWEHTTKRTIH